MKSFSVACAIFIFISLEANAQSFTLSCEDKATVGFWFFGASGDVKERSEWSDDRFGDTWLIEYSGSAKKAWIDGRETFVSIGNKIAIMIETFDNGIGKTVNTYAIDLISNKVIGTTANGANMLRQSTLKGKLVEFECKRLR